MNILNYSYVLLLIVNYGSCLILQGTLTSGKDWVFLGKFCFVSEQSKVSFNISYPLSYAVQALSFYYDDQWSKVYNKDLDCEAKLAQLVAGQKINLNPNSSIIECELNSTDPSNKMVQCTDRRGFVTARVRWWFLTVSRCSFPINITYSMLFTNGDSVFRKHFSADEFGVFETTIAMFIIYFLMIIIVAIYAKIMHNKFLFHSTFKLYMASIIIEFVYYLIFMAEYGQFANSGISTPGLLTVGRIIDAISQIVFLLMLILLAKGLNVTRGRLRTITKIKLIIFFGVYLAAYVISFAYSEALFDPGVVNYYLNSPGGIAVLCIKLIFGWLWFCYAIFFTLKNYPEKRQFYTVLAVFFSIWFWAGPLVTLACNYLVVDYIRQFVAYISQSLIMFVGHLYFLIITCPKYGNKTFPYHVKTNKVNVTIKNDNDTIPFPHHKEQEGGHTHFNEPGNELILSSLFSVQNNGEKYKISDAPPTIT